MQISWLKRALVAVGFGALTFGLASAPASALPLTPAGTTCTTNDNSNLNESQVEALAASCFGAGGTFDLTLAYKDNVGGAEEGPFAPSYETTFSNTPADPADALIEWINGQPIINCPSCFLLVKDGNQEPAQYLFDISSWDGMEDLVLTGFWPANGAISNVAIYSGEFLPGPFPNPEPGTLALIGLGLLAAAFARRSRA